MAERRRSTDSQEARRTTGSNEVLDRLFVYSTLRQGQTARSLIANHVARCVPASTIGAIYAFPMGYAGFVEADPPRRVIGEVLWLTDLAATFGLLDAYEGEDFARVIKQVELDTGEPVWTWIYVLADPDTARHGALIEHGDWERYALEQR
ncbi:MAG TPA: gamma-glutamylcyclotransferase family protein [Kofleriaceae bacterium]|nr:gamma-glutamylcyclotransferase family protein [Kofleriaceae bacterium]